LLSAVAHLLREISVGFLGHGQRLRDTPSLEPGRVLTLLVRTIAAGLAGVTPAMTLFPPTPNRRWEKPIFKQSHRYTGKRAAPRRSRRAMRGNHPGSLSFPRAPVLVPLRPGRLRCFRPLRPGDFRAPPR